MSEPIVTVDIGGTHARFAIAEVADGRVAALGPEATTLHTKDHRVSRRLIRISSRQQGGTLPRAVTIAIAEPRAARSFAFTNNPWIIRPALIGEKLEVDRHVLVNDFEAVGAYGCAGRLGLFRALAGPDGPLPASGTISVIGPGTGLGVAHIWRGGGDYRVQATEGGSYRFRAARQHRGRDPGAAAQAAPPRIDRADRVGPRHRRHLRTLAELEGRAVTPLDDRTIWTGAISGEDALAAAAARSLLPVAGQRRGRPRRWRGASGVVIAGGLGAAHPRPASFVSGFPRTLRRQGAVREYDGGDPGEADHASAAWPVRGGSGVRAAVCG